MTQAGFTIAGSAHPICPVMLGDARLASLMADDMLKLGETAGRTGSTGLRTCEHFFILEYIIRGSPVYT